jgi:hypothetical protein
MKWSHDYKSDDFNMGRGKFVGDFNMGRGKFVGDFNMGRGKFVGDFNINIKCDSVSNDLKCPLNNGVSIVQKLLVKLSNTSTMLLPHVANTVFNYALSHLMCTYILSERYLIKF